MFNKLTDIVGNTPMLEIRGIEGQKARLVLKLEYFNPGGSVKDRIALSMIEDAEERGVLKPGATIIEPTSGNTGVGLSWVAAAKGYKVILTMPDTMSLERRGLLKALGAKLELTPGPEGMKGAIKKAEELNAAIEGSLILGQFSNPANPSVHERTTGPEIWKDTEGEVDVFVAGVGTGGTVTGVGRALKKFKKAVRVVAVEPAGSPVLSSSVSGKHKIQGIGAGFIPEIYDSSVVDEIITVTDEDAIRASRFLAVKEGLLVGFSSGAAFHSAMEFAKKEEYRGKMIVALLPDTGERYLSTVLFAKEEYPL